MATKTKVMDLRRGSDAPRHVAVKSSHPPERNEPRTRKPLRKRRRNLRMIMGASIGSILMLCIYGVHWASFLPHYSIQTIKIIGVQNIPETTVRDHVISLLHPEHFSFISPANLYAYSPGTIANSLVGTFPRIASARITRDLSPDNAIAVSITERRSYALWCGAACYVMDEYGFIFAPATLDTHTDTGYIFGGNHTDAESPIGYLYASTHFDALIALMQRLTNEGFAPRGIMVESDTDFAVPLGAGFSVKATFGEDATALVRNLKLVLSSDAIRSATSSLEYVDLRFGDRVYYKMQSDMRASNALH